MIADVVDGPWIQGLNHLALVVDEVPKARWFFETVLQCPVTLWRETQLMVHLGSDVMVVKTSSEAVDSHRQLGEFQRQVMDHYGFFAPSAEHVSLLAERLESFKLTIEKGPYTRSDGFALYFRDPFGNLVEYFWYQPTQ